MVLTVWLRILAEVRDFAGNPMGKTGVLRLRKVLKYRNMRPATHL